MLRKFLNDLLKLTPVESSERQTAVLASENERLASIMQVQAFHCRKLEGKLAIEKAKQSGEKVYRVSGTTICDAIIAPFVDFKLGNTLEQVRSQYNTDVSVTVDADLKLELFWSPETEPVLAA